MPHTKNTWADLDPTKVLSAARMTNLEKQYDDAMGDTAGLYGKDVRPWAATTAYTAGQAVVSPAGDVVTAISAHTSGTSFNSANWNLSPSFVLKSSAYLSVKDYGAVGDGTTNDLAAFNNAINAAAAFGAQVFVPPASYRVTNSITLKSNVTLFGAGAGSIIVQDMAVPAHALVCASAAVNIGVHDIAFDASASTNNRCAIAFNGATTVMIDRVVVKKAYYDAIQLIACFNSVVSNCIGLACGRNGIAVDQTVGASSKVTISNCIMIADPSSANLNSGFDVESGQTVIITGCTSEGPFPFGCSVLGEISGTYLSKWVNIRGLTVKGQTGAAVYLYGAVGTVTDALVDGLIVESGTGREGVRIEGDVQRWTVSNSNLGGTSTASVNGIITLSSGGVFPGPGIVSATRITGYTSSGISAASQVVVSGCHIFGMPGSGVFLSSALDCVVTGSILTGNSRYGIESSGTSDRVTEVGNNLRGNASGDVSLVGSANVTGLYVPKSGLTAPPTTIGFLVQPPATAGFAAGTLTVDASKGNSQATLTANVTTMTFSNPTLNQKMTVTVIQDATGGRTYVWPANAKFAGGAGPSDTTANKRTSVTFIYDGTNWQEVNRAVAVG